MAKPTAQEAAIELLRRRRARATMVGFSQAIEIPGRPVNDDENGWLFRPVETGVALHHRLMMEAIELACNRRHGRVMLLMPPGSAKSTYASRVAPAWYLGGGADRRCILASYGSDLARKHGRAARSIVRSPAYSGIFGATISDDTAAADEWALTNGSEFMSGGILSGITGNRAGLLIIDDPVKGRDEAESETIRAKILDAYQDDLLTRLIPGGSIVMATTRWHMADLAGEILPEKYNGESGTIAGRDGNDWEVLCFQAKCERTDDPLGRQVGEYLWPEWFDAKHWGQFERNARTWSALYQQRPAPEEGSYFKRDWFRRYGRLPDGLRYYAASDYAVSDGQGDFTVHAIVGIDAAQNLYIADLWRGQSSSDVWIEAFCDLVERWKPIRWVEESGQIVKSLGPFIERRMRERRAWVMREQIASTHDKQTRARSFQGYAAMGRVFLPETAAWVEPMLTEILSFPVGSNDDQVDALSLIGRMIDRMVGVPVAPPERQNKPTDYRRKETAEQSWRI